MPAASARDSAAPRGRIAAVGSAFPPNHYDQETLLRALKKHWSERYFNLDRLEQLHRNVLVGSRRLALPIDEYEKLEGFGDSNAAWTRVAEEVGAAAVAAALEKAALPASAIDAIYFVTVTGIATPSIDARLVERLGFRPDVKRIPIFGLGCVAGAAGIARAADYTLGHPGEIAVLLSVELCSLTLQRDDLSIPNLIASGLFGDGAAAAIVAGAGRSEPAALAGPEVVASRSVFYPGTDRVMGWDVANSGFQIVLSADVPKVVEEHLRGDVDAFLAEQGMTLADIDSFVCHPGGPKVLEAMARALEAPDGALDLTWKSLAEVGNLSSTSVLLVLEATLANRDGRRPERGRYGLLLAMGPGFCSELVLLRW
jgi:alkylresorcinol/alkylpyrone synthase